MSEPLREFDGEGRRIIRVGPDRGRVRSTIDPAWTETAAPQREGG